MYWLELWWVSVGTQLWGVRISRAMNHGISVVLRLMMLLLSWLSCFHCMDENVKFSSISYMSRTLSTKLIVRFIINHIECEWYRCMLVRYSTWNFFYDICLAVSGVGLKSTNQPSQVHWKSNGKAKFIIFTKIWKVLVVLRFHQQSIVCRTGTICCTEYWVSDD